MGDSIIFRPRARGLPGRLHFVRGELTAGDGGVPRGDGTMFPLKVTPRQLYEITYLVKDAWFTSGAHSYFAGSSWSFEVGGAPTPGANLIIGGEYSYLERAYSVLLDPAFDFAKFFLKEGYSSGIPSYASYRLGFEVSDSERAIFTKYALPGYSSSKLNSAGNPLATPYRPLGPFNGAGYNDHWFRNGFHHLCTMNISTPTPPTYGIYSVFTDSGGSGTTYYGSLESSLIFSGRVAWVDSSGSGDPLDPLNELYIEANFIAGTGYGGSAPANFISTFNGTYMLPAGYDLVLELSSSSVRCPIFYDYPGTADPVGIDFVITAKEWWPYKNLDGTPKYNPNTGGLP